MERAAQKPCFGSGNELAALAARQINYHVMGYYPITPSTQIAEFLDQMGADGEHSIAMIPAEGEHSAAGICYGAAAGGARAFNATSANGLLYALEQLPVQSGTRLPMVLNLACRSVSGPLSIHCDHSDLMYALNCGWIILFADSPQEVYDLNLCALKIAEEQQLPVLVAFDGFFTSHQKRNCSVFAEDKTVQDFIGPCRNGRGVLDPDHPLSIGSHMEGADLLNNRYQLHQAMEEARESIPEVFREYAEISDRKLQAIKSYRAEDAEVLLFVLGSAFHTARAAADRLRQEGRKVGVLSLSVLRPFPGRELARLCQRVKTLVVAERQDSYGAGGGSMSLEIRAALQQQGLQLRVLSRIYGLGGMDLSLRDAEALFDAGFASKAPSFAYWGTDPGRAGYAPRQLFRPIAGEMASPGCTAWQQTEKGLQILGGSVQETLSMPKRLAPGHSACPGCGIPVNLNLLLRGMEGNVVLLFQTGCAMIVTSSYPKTAFRVPWLHNLFQNGAATLAGLSEAFRQRQLRGELEQGSITFVMVTGDGGMDIGMGSALASALRGDGLVIFEYDNGGYMNTGYQLSYSTPKGARSATSHLGPKQWGKRFFHKDTPRLMAATGMPYVATAAESSPADFIHKAAKAQYYAQHEGTAYLKALSACPLNWGCPPNQGRDVVSAAVDCCFFPLYEVEKGLTSLSYDPEAAGAKTPIDKWFLQMERTKHLCREEYKEVLSGIQQEIDARWHRLKLLSDHPEL